MSARNSLKTVDNFKIIRQEKLQGGLCLNLYSFVELSEPMRRLASQEDLKLPLTAVHSIHHEAAQLGRMKLATETCEILGARTFGMIDVFYQIWFFYLTPFLLEE